MARRRAQEVESQFFNPRVDYVSLRPPRTEMDRWLREVEDACFAAGRDHQRRLMIARRPHWRLWELLQRIAWRLGPYSRIRFLLEPDEDEHVAYREKWRNRFPDQPVWDFFLRFLWLYAPQTRLRRLIAPDRLSA